MTLGKWVQSYILLYYSEDGGSNTKIVRFCGNDVELMGDKEPKDFQGIGRAYKNSASSS